MEEGVNQQNVGLYSRLIFNAGWRANSGGVELPGEPLCDAQSCESDRALIRLSAWGEGRAGQPQPEWRSHKSNLLMLNYLRGRDA